MHHKGVEHGILAPPNEVGTSSNMTTHSTLYSDVPCNTCAFKPGRQMSHNWLHTPDSKVSNEEMK
jgi:hypothetical protein